MTDAVKPVREITPDECLAAFITSELKPRKGDYYPFQGCACGLGAIAATKGWDAWDIQEKLDEYYGEGYRLGFVHGFDGERMATTITKYNTEEKLRGYKDGQAAWEAVKHLQEELT